MISLRSVLMKSLTTKGVCFGFFALGGGEGSGGGVAVDEAALAYDFFGFSFGACGGGGAGGGGGGGTPAVVSFKAVRRALISAVCWSSREVRLLMVVRAVRSSSCRDPMAMVLVSSCNSRGAVHPGGAGDEEVGCCGGTGCDPSFL